jgi:hypothetical protein
MAFGKCRQVWRAQPWIFNRVHSKPIVLFLFNAKLQLSGKLKHIFLIINISGIQCFLRKISVCPAEHCSSQSKFRDPILGPNGALHQPKLLKGF